MNLLEFDNRGKLQSSAAKEWGTEDGGQTWTFKLRDDVTWVDVNGSYKADVAAGMSNEQMWYSGAYTLTTYISSNEKVLTRNPAYFDKDCTRFDTVTIRVVESALVDFTCKDFVFFENGDGYSSHVIRQMGLPEGGGKSPAAISPTRPRSTNSRP